LGDHPGIDVKGLDPVSFSILLCILTGREWKVSVVDEFELVNEQSEDGPWTYQVPQQLIDKVVQLESEDLKQVAEAWMVAAELNRSGWKKSDVDAVLPEIVSLAKRSKAEGKQLYLWTSL